MKRESDKALSDDQIKDIMKWRKEFHLKYDQKMASNAKSPRGKHFDSNTKNTKLEKLEKELENSFRELRQKKWRD